MASIVRTCSPAISASKKSPASSQPSSAVLSGNESLKRRTSGSVTPQASGIRPVQTDRVNDTAATQKQPDSSRKDQGQPQTTLDALALRGKEVAASANIKHDAIGHVTALQSCPPGDTLTDANQQNVSHGHSTHTQAATSTVQNVDLQSDAINLNNTKQIRPVAASIPRWRLTIDYEAKSTISLGKNRYLVWHLVVPSEASARYAQIKETLETDVRRLIAGIQPSTQILWSYRLCMIGLKTGTTVTAEPTILISCGSLRCKRKLKASFQRIRPHYLEGLGMSLLIRYDKSAPVLAGQAGTLAVDENEQLHPGAIRIQRNQSSTSCGLKIMIDSYSFPYTHRSYATLGGIIKLGGTFYGLTAAHPILQTRPSLSKTQVSDDFEDSSNFGDFYDSSDDEEEEDEDEDDDEDVECAEASSFQELSKIPRYHSQQVKNLHAHQDMDFVRLPGVWPGSFMSYSFNGQSRSIMKPVSADTTISDWAILEVSEACIRPNSYVESPRTSKHGASLRVVLDSVIDSSQMSSGAVHILSDAETPQIGYLSMNPSSLQLRAGVLNVHEIFLEEPVTNGISGSWVVRGNQLMGMVIALSNGGLSCYIVAMWKVLEEVKTVCSQDSRLSDGLSATLQITEGTPKLVKQSRQVRFPESTKIDTTDAFAAKQHDENPINQYYDLLSRIVNNQELISKTLSTLTAPSPMLGRFLDPDERSDLFPDPCRALNAHERALEILKPADSMSQNSTLISAKNNVSESETEKDSATRVLQAQSLAPEDLMAYIKSSPWLSQAPTVLKDPLKRVSLHHTQIGSLSLPRELESSKTILECYNINKEGTATRLYNSDRATRYASLSAMVVDNNANTSHDVVGKMIISKDPSSLHLAALHLVLAEDFDMNQILHMIVDEGPSKAYMKGYLEPWIVKQRSFVFSFKYHCIIGEGYEPRPWQKYDQESTATENGLSLSTCSAVVGLSLSSISTQSIRQKSHRDQAMKVHIFDPLGPWKLLRVQCFPDSTSTLEDYESDSRLFNGPEAFVAALLSEYQDATSRYKALQQKISTIVLPTTTLVFDSQLRDKLLFENSNYTLSRRYFWAQQVLKLLNEEIEDMLTAYAQTFSDTVWKGEHKYIWPGVADLGPKYHVWRQRMASLRKDFEYEVTQLQSLQLTNKRLQNEISDLRNQLLTGLALEESKQSVDNAKAMKNFTILTMLFLPLTFVSSFFGMNYIDYDDDSSHRTTYVVLLAASTIGTISFFIFFSFHEIKLWLNKYWIIVKGWDAALLSFIFPPQLPQHVSYGRNRSPRRVSVGTTGDQLPAGVKELWLDRRNPERWYAFWIVIIIGALTILLQLVQLMIQVWAIFKLPGDVEQGVS